MYYHIEAEIDFDDRRESTPEEISFILEKYDGVSIGHDRTGTTTLFLNTEENLTKRKLEGLLENVYRVIRFEKTKLKNDKSTAKMTAKNK